jgi:hypothetical protein
VFHNFAQVVGSSSAGPPGGVHTAASTASPAVAPPGSQSASTYPLHATPNHQPAPAAKVSLCLYDYGIHTMRVYNGSVFLGNVCILFRGYTHIMYIDRFVYRSHVFQICAQVIGSSSAGPPGGVQTQGPTALPAVAPPGSESASTYPLHAAQDHQPAPAAKASLC